MKYHHTQLHNRLLPLLLLAALLITSTACDDAASPPTAISVRITQPTDSSTVRDTVLRILTEVSSNCGCQAHVEFHLDGVHHYSDYLPFYHFDWDIRNLSGWHTIVTRVVVANRGDAWDTVRVLLNPPDSLDGNPFRTQS
ncbi:MAG: hypothetical protein RRA94_07110 [Bacteroidota bacterium]|nr:hypothetical protein [Bacteroidota bacterium]